MRTTRDERCTPGSVRGLHPTVARSLGSGTSSLGHRSLRRALRPRDGSASMWRASPRAALRLLQLLGGALDASQSCPRAASSAAPAARRSPSLPRAPSSGARRRCSTARTCALRSRVLAALAATDGVARESRRRGIGCAGSLSELLQAGVRVVAQRATIAAKLPGSRELVGWTRDHRKRMI